MWVNSNLMRNYNYQKRIHETGVYWTYYQIYVLDINAHNDLGCTGIEAARLSSVEELNQSVLTIRLWKTSGKINSKKCIDKRSNGHSPDNHEWRVKTWLSIACLQFKFNEVQNDYLAQTLVHFAGVMLKKINSCLRKLINQFILRECKLYKWNNFWDHSVNTHS